MRPPTQQDKAVQRRPEVSIRQLLQSTRHKLLVRRANPRSSNGKTIGAIYTLLARLFCLQHLLRTLGNGHVPRRLKDAPPTREVLHGLFLDLDIQQHERMQTHLYVFAHPVVERRWSPVLQEEDHADGLAEVVKLQAGAADAGHDRGIGDDFGLDSEFAGAEDEVGVGCRTVDELVIATGRGQLASGHTQMDLPRLKIQCRPCLRLRGCHRCRFQLVRDPTR